ncbi:MAG: hypothetical protein ACOCU0_03565 [Bacillota bacterium]
MKNQSPAASKRKVQPDHNVPMFSYRGAFMIILSAVVTTMLVPELVNVLFNVEAKVTMVVSNTVLLGPMIAYIQHCYESGNPVNRTYWFKTTFFGLMFGIITYLWFFLEIFI